MERRTFLVLGAATVGLAGCTPETADPSPPSSAPPRSTAPVDPDSRLRDEVAASEAALITAYRSAITANPGLAPDLEPFLAHHEQHLARVAPKFAAESGSPSPVVPAAPSPVVPAAPSAAASASATASEGSDPDESSSASQEPTPPSTADALAGLAAAESQAQGQRASACNRAQDPALARDLCLIAASEAQHAVVLEGLAPKGSGS